MISSSFFVFFMLYHANFGVIYIHTGWLFCPPAEERGHVLHSWPIWGCEHLEADSKYFKIHAGCTVNVIDTCCVITQCCTSLYVLHSCSVCLCAVAHTPFITLIFFRVRLIWRNKSQLKGLDPEMFQCLCRARAAWHWSVDESECDNQLLELHKQNCEVWLHLNTRLCLFFR